MNTGKPLSQTDEWALKLSQLISAMVTSKLNEEGFCTYLEVQDICTELFAIPMRIHALGRNEHLQMVESE